MTSLDNILVTLASLRFDSKKTEFLVTLVSNRMLPVISAIDIAHIISLFTHDSGRKSALDVLYSYIPQVSLRDLAVITAAFVHDSGKSEAVALLAQKLPARRKAGDCLLVVKTFRHDSAKHDCIMLLLGSGNSRRYSEGPTVAEINEESQYRNIHTTMPTVSDIEEEVIQDTVSAQVTREIPPEQRLLAVPTDDTSMSMTVLVQFLDILREDDKMLSFLQQVREDVDTSDAEKYCAQLSELFVSEKVFRKAMKVLGIAESTYQQCKPSGDPTRGQVLEIFGREYKTKDVFEQGSLTVTNGPWAARVRATGGGGLDIRIECNGQITSSMRLGGGIQSRIFINQHGIQIF